MSVYHLTLPVYMYIHMEREFSYNVYCCSLHLYNYAMSEKWTIYENASHRCGALMCILGEAIEILILRSFFMHSNVR